MMFENAVLVAIDDEDPDRMPLGWAAAQPAALAVSPGFAGSVSQQVMRHAHCPVLIAH
jgi:hypothetical protein